MKIGISDTGPLFTLYQINITQLYFFFYIKFLF